MRGQLKYAFVKSFEENTKSGPALNQKFHAITAAVEENLYGTVHGILTKRAENQSTKSIKTLAPICGRSVKINRIMTGKRDHLKLP